MLGGHLLARDAHEGDGVVRRVLVRVVCRRRVRVGGRRRGGGWV